MENERYERIINALEQLIKQGEKSLCSRPESYHSSTKDSATQDDMNSPTLWRLGINDENQEKRTAAIPNSNEMTKTRVSHLLTLNDRKNRKNNQFFLRYSKRPGTFIRNNHNSNPQKGIFSKNNNSNNSWGRTVTTDITTNAIGTIFIAMAISAHSVYSYSKENVILLLLLLLTNRKRRRETIMVGLLDRISCCFLQKSPFKSHTLISHSLNLTFQILSLCFLQS
jgi:hypothetical protein